MPDTTVTDTLWTRLLEALALPADTDPETVVLAVEDLVTTPTPKAVAASPAGTVQVDPDTLATLRRDAEQGRLIAAAAVQRERTQLVEAAVLAGRITPARRVHWQTALAADPAAATTLASLPAGLVPLTEIGHAGDTETEQTAAWFH